MIITGFVKDKSTNLPLPGASVFVADESEKPVGSGVLTDDTGRFELDSKLLDDPNNFLGVSYAGYNDDLILPGGTGPYTFLLVPESGGLEGIFVTARRKVKKVVKKNKAWIWWVTGAVVITGIGFFIYKKKMANKTK